MTVHLKPTAETLTRHCEPPLGGAAIQGRMHCAAALDCFVAALIAMTVGAAGESVILLAGIIPDAVDDDSPPSSSAKAEDPRLSFVNR